ncbi:anti-sigma factor family protein [Gorillibacterium sp. sgz5001074]|uniref:anti-sigma factor family protein n=1 Tax=Gorillibacterium sp. sgz5001074 TaxID=3446695 RepID=UPI003F67E7B0
MKCNEVQELFGVYFDVPDDDPRRASVDEHIKTCGSCREEFEMWEESTDLIRLAKEDTEPYLVTSLPVTNRVMSRIYTDESWRMPVTGRIYSIPYKLRRNLTAVIAFCLALFVVSFVYQFNESDSRDVQASAQYGIKQTAKASDNPADSLNVHSMSRATLVSASPTIIDPVKLGPIRTVPDYALSMSILGLISTLLIMNWLNRTRA